MSALTLPDDTFTRLRAGWADHQRQKADHRAAATARAEQEQRMGHAAGRAWAENTADFDLLDRAYQLRDIKSAWMNKPFAVEWVVARATGQDQHRLDPHFAGGFITGVAAVMAAFFERLNAAT